MDPVMHRSCPEGKHLPHVGIPRAFSFAAYSQSVSLGNGTKQKKAPRDAGGAEKMMSCCPEELHETCSVLQSYLIVLATEENALLALLPTKLCRQRAPRLQPASPHIPRCPDLLRLHSFRGRSNITLLSWLECFRFSGLADEKIRILTLNTRNQLVSS